MKTFSDKACKLGNESQSFIEGLFVGKKRVIKLCDPDNQDKILDMPTFTIYGKHGYVGWCNAFELRKVKNTFTGTNMKPIIKTLIEVKGIERETGDVESEYLSGLDIIDLIHMASYFQEINKLS